MANGFLIFNLLSDPPPPFQNSLWLFTHRCISHPLVSSAAALGLILLAGHSSKNNDDLYFAARFVNGFDGRAR